MSLLTNNNISEIYKSNKNCLIKFIELLNFNKAYPENHTFCNTSLEGKYVSYIDTKNQTISKMNKVDCYDLVLATTLDNINIVIKTVKNKLKPNHYSKFIKLIQDTKDLYLSNKNSKNIYNTQINQIAYNNKELILKSWKNANIKDIDEENNDSDSSSDTDSIFI